jgi:hypothetical protein
MLARLRGDQKIAGGSEAVPVSRATLGIASTYDLQHGTVCEAVDVEVAVYREQTPNTSALRFSTISSANLRPVSSESREPSG